jgi:hypothetical protein
LHAPVIEPFLSKIHRLEMLAKSLVASRDCWRQLSFGIGSEFDVPVSQIQKVLPAFMVLKPQVDLNEWPPFRAFWFPHQMHASLIWRPVGLARVTGDAGTHYILPSSGSASISRNNVVEIQIFPVEKMAAILTGVAIPLEDVVSRELHFLLGQSIKENQKDDSGDSNPE